MQALNLDPTFNPYHYLPQMGVKTFTFPGGEEHVKLLQDKIWRDNRIMITTRLTNSARIMQLLVATNALKRMGAKAQDIHVLIPYLPYARQDRQMVHGEPLSLRVMADLINSQGYASVKVFDPHSSVSAALINNMIEVSNVNFCRGILQDKKDYLLVSPDAGATKKVAAVAKALKYDQDIIQAEKRRNLNTGEITNIHLDRAELFNKDCYIVDDICDGGGTFVMLADRLKTCGAGNVHLIVSHGIFSKGLILQGIESIYCTDSVRDIKSDVSNIQFRLNDFILSHEETVC